MSTIRIEKREQPFTIVSNEVINDGRLTLKARGLMCLMLSRPDDWIWHKKEVMSHCVEGRASFNSAWAELIRYGYIVKSGQNRSQVGKFVHFDYILKEMPLADFPRAENPVTRKPAPTNTNITKTNLTNNTIAQMAEDIYSLYPRKVSKAPAISAIIKALKVIEYDKLKSKVVEFSECVKTWKKDQLQYVPYPASWFNGRRWEDDVAEWRRDEESEPADREFTEDGAQYAPTL